MLDKKYEKMKRKVILIQNDKYMKMIFTCPLSYPLGPVLFDCWQPHAKRVSYGIRLSQFILTLATKEF